MECSHTKPALTEIALKKTLLDAAITELVVQFESETSLKINNLKVIPPDVISNERAPHGKFLIIAKKVEADLGFPRLEAYLPQ